MVMTYERRLPAIAFALVALVLAGCTYNEDELRAGHPARDASGGIDLASPVTEPPADAGPMDTASVDAAVVLDLASDATEVESDATVAIDGEIDTSAAWQDASVTPALDVAPGEEPDAVSPDNASDLPITGADTHAQADAAAADTQVTESGSESGAKSGIDGANQSG